MGGAAYTGHCGSCSTYCATHTHTPATLLPRVKGRLSLAPGQAPAGTMEQLRPAPVLSLMQVRPAPGSRSRPGKRLRLWPVFRTQAETWHVPPGHLALQLVAQLAPFLDSSRATCSAGPITQPTHSVVWIASVLIRWLRLGCPAFQDIGKRVGLVRLLGPPSSDTLHLVASSLTTRARRVFLSELKGRFLSCRGRPLALHVLLLVKNSGVLSSSEW